MDITITITISVPDGAAVEVTTAAVKEDPPSEGLRNPVPEPEVAPASTLAEALAEQAIIKDPELLSAMSKTAEKVGADRVKEIVKGFTAKDSKGGVRDVEQIARPVLMAALKEAIGVELTTSEAPSAEAPNETGQQRRRRRG